MGELMETPIMLVITILVRGPARLGMGCIALALLLVAEFGFVLWFRGMSIREYFASRDPVAGTVYYVMLGVFAVMPLLVR